jgi:hypothetical protein
MWVSCFIEPSVRLALDPPETLSVTSKAHRSTQAFPSDNMEKEIYKSILEMGESTVRFHPTSKRVWDFPLTSVKNI